MKFTRCFMLQVSIYGLHHSSKYWDAPDAFLPERWLEPAHASSEKQSISGTTPCGGQLLI